MYVLEKVYTLMFIIHLNKSTINIKIFRIIYIHMPRPRIKPGTLSLTLVRFSNHLIYLFVLVCTTNVLKEVSKEYISCCPSLPTPQTQLKKLYHLHRIIMPQRWSTVKRRCSSANEYSSHTLSMDLNKCPYRF